MNRLSEMVNIGTTVEQKLIEVGINTPEELINVGSKEAYLRLRTVDSGACLSMLTGIEGAIRGIRWHYLDDSVKADLKTFFKSLK